MLAPTEPMEQSPRAGELPFYGPNELLPVLLACVMGFQHSLSMVGGIITPPALVSSGLIMSGLCSILQVVRLKIPFTKYFIGSGLLSVMGTSFTFLPIAQGAVAAQMNDPENPVDFPTAYGGLLGCFMIGSFGMGRRAPSAPITRALTCRVGFSTLPYGSPVYIGLGFFVMVCTLVLEALRLPLHAQLPGGHRASAGLRARGLTSDPEGNPYVSTQGMQDAPAVTFLWVTYFPISLYAPALLPVIIGFVVSGVESIGDLTASGEASGLDPDSMEQTVAVQGGLLGDSTSSFLAALAFSMPNTTFSQNNGIGAFFTSIPQPVLGGMTTFLFANITVSGIKVITSSL
eukprot:jgi/Tetstr1/425113/TSEL_015575.t1